MKKQRKLGILTVPRMLLTYLLYIEFCYYFTMVS